MSPMVETNFSYFRKYSEMIFCDFIEQLRTGRFRAIELNGDESVATFLLLDLGELKEMTPFNNSMSS